MVGLVHVGSHLDHQFSQGSSIRRASIPSMRAIKRLRTSVSGIGLEGVFFALVRCFCPVTGLMCGELHFGTGAKLPCRREAAVVCSRDRGIGP